MKRKSPYPLFFRERVVTYYLETFKISKGTLFNWIKLYKANKLEPNKRKSKFGENIVKYIKIYVLVYICIIKIDF